MSLKLKIVTPDELLVNNTVDQLVFPTARGQYNPLPGHTTFLAELGTGMITFLINGKTQIVPVSGGFVEIRDDNVTILADSTVIPQESESVPETVH